MLGRFLHRAKSKADDPSDNKGAPFDPATMTDDDLRLRCRHILDVESAETHAVVLRQFHSVMQHRQKQQMAIPLDSDCIDSIVRSLYVHQAHHGVARWASRILADICGATSTGTELADTVLCAAENDPNTVFAALVIGPSDDADASWAKHASLEMIERLTSRDAASTTRMVHLLLRSSFIIPALCTTLAAEERTNGALEYQALHTLHALATALTDGNCSHGSAAGTLNADGASPARRRVMRGELNIRLAFEGGLEALLRFIARKGGLQMQQEEKTETAEAVQVAALTLEALLMGHVQVTKYVIERRLIAELAALLPKVDSSGTRLVNAGLIRIVAASSSSPHWVDTLLIGLRLVTQCIAMLRGDTPSLSLSAVREQLDFITSHTTLMQSAILVYAELAAARHETLSTAAMLLMAVMAPVLPQVSWPSFDVQHELLSASCSAIIDRLSRKGDEWCQSTNVPFALFPSILAASLRLMDVTHSDSCTTSQALEAEGMLCSALIVLADAVSKKLRSDRNRCSLLAPYQLMIVLIHLLRFVSSNGEREAPVAAMREALLALINEDSCCSLLAAASFVSTLQCCHEAEAYETAAILIAHSSAVGSLTLMTPTASLPTTCAAAHSCMFKIAAVAANVVDNGPISTDLLECENRSIIAALVAVAVSSVGLSLCPPNEVNDELPHILGEWLTVVSAALQAVPEKSRNEDIVLRMAASQNSPVFGDTQQTWCPLRRWHDNASTATKHGSHVASCVSFISCSTVQGDVRIPKCLPGAPSELLTAVQGFQSAICGLIPDDLTVPSLVAIAPWLERAKTSVERANALDVTRAAPSSNVLDGSLAAEREKIIALEAALDEERREKAACITRYEKYIAELHSTIAALSARDARAKKVFDLIDGFANSA